MNATFLIKKGSNAPVLGPLEFSGGETVEFIPQNTSGWESTSAVWRIISFPAGFAVPAGFSVNGLFYEYIGIAPPSFVVPVKTVRWGTFTVELSLPGAKFKAAFFTLSPNVGLRETAFLEENEVDPLRGAATSLQQNLKLLDTKVGSTTILLADINFAALPNQTFPANGAVTINGNGSWIRGNIAQDRQPAEIINGTGLVFYPVQATDMTTTANTMPHLRIALKNLNPALWVPRRNIRVTAYFFNNLVTENSHAGVVSLTNGGTSWVSHRLGRNTATNRGSHFLGTLDGLSVGSPTNLNFTLDPSATNHNVSILNIDHPMPTRMWVDVGTVVDFTQDPSETTRFTAHAVYNTTHVTGHDNPALRFATANNIDVMLGSIRAGAANATFITTFKRLKVELV